MKIRVDEKGNVTHWESHQQYIQQLKIQIEQGGQSIISQNQTTKKLEEAKKLNSEFLEVEKTDRPEVSSFSFLRCKFKKTKNGYKEVWEEVCELGMCLAEINKLKAELAETDYCVIKCCEALLSGEEMSYDLKFMEDRRAKRKSIQELKQIIKEKQNETN
jgi:hypothetical protein